MVDEWLSGSLDWHIQSLQIKSTIEITLERQKVPEISASG